MLKKFVKGSNFSLLKQSIEEGINCSVFGLNIGEKLALLDDSAFLFYVVDSVDNAGQILEKFLDMGRTPLFLSDSINPLSSEFETQDKLVESLLK